LDRRRTRLSRTELYERVWTIPNLQLAQKFASNFRGESTKFILFNVTGTAINSSQSLVQERFKSNHKADAQYSRLRWVSHFLPIGGPSSIRHSQNRGSRIMGRSQGKLRRANDRCMSWIIRSDRVLANDSTGSSRSCPTSAPAATRKGATTPLGRCVGCAADRSWPVRSGSRRSCFPVKCL
jgi:hypothetical protein